ncbi:hypothetical protein [Salinivibrio sp. VYel1]|uniref:hypothetical protein n=1 Tax=Salinivibrio sp. VYel1 TaxID=2490490 RepID=UPI00128E68E8|nr:hypothetical protein [Salinivibrio sp. VYel1]MPX89959.1 hypothetical protein [Salinivibrio sp. VYel1]
MFMQTHGQQANNNGERLRATVEKSNASLTTVALMEKAFFRKRPRSLIAGHDKHSGTINSQKVNVLK